MSLHKPYNTKEIKIGIPHEGWELRHPSSKEYVLKNKSYWHTLGKGVDVEGMRTMGAAESNMNLFSKRLKKYGYSWSHDGLDRMVDAMIHHFEGKLIEIIQNSKQMKRTEIKRETGKKYRSFATLLTERTRQPIGAIQSHLPALVGDDQGKPYIKALRGLVGY